LREQRWWYVGIFIQHDPVETEPAQSVPVVAAVEADPAAAEQVDAQLRLVGALARTGRANSLITSQATVLAWL
jgi:hypothetical protein